jgi:predicted RNase H-like HicB family nuclease
MTRKYPLVIERDPTGYSAYVPELPTILVTGRSVEQLTDRAAEAIRLYRESVGKATVVRIYKSINPTSGV